MAGILDLYGIKEVADVVFWDTETKRPVLYLDTLKVSTIEETAEQTEARGGKGNPPLVIWDYGKEITLTLEDALFSMKSMAVMHNSKWLSDPTNASVVTSASTVQAVKKFVTGDNTATSPLVPSDIAELGGTYYDEFGNVVESASLSVNTRYLVGYIKSDITAQQIVVRSDDFPGTYRITGDTYARSQDTGKDEFFQFEIPLAKVNPEQTITMQAEGDPSTFSMTVRVMRPSDGKMMILTKYTNESSGPVTQYAIDYGTNDHTSTGTETNGVVILTAAAGEGSSYATKAVPTPSDAVINYSTSDSAVATVNDTGVIAAVANGSTTVTAAIAEDPTKKVAYSVTVNIT